MARYPSTVMVSVVCPWDDDEQLDEAMFRRAIRHALDAGFRHIYVFGTAGEGYAVDSRPVPAGRSRSSATSWPGTDAQPMVGVIGLSTANVLERLGVAHDLGFRAFQISLPTWSPLDDAEVVAYFEAVCGAFPDSPFMHYNTARVGRLVDGGLYRELVDRVPNLVATKTMTGDLGVVAGRRPRRAGADALPDGAVDRVRRAVRRGRAARDVRRPGAEAVVGAPRGRPARVATRRPPRSASWFERLNDTIFAPLMVDRRVDGAYDKTIEKLSPGHGRTSRCGCCRRTGPSRTPSSRTPGDLRDRFPELRPAARPA